MKHAWAGYDCVMHRSLQWSTRIRAKPKRIECEALEWIGTAPGLWLLGVWTMINAYSRQLSGWTTSRAATLSCALASRNEFKRAV